MRPKDVIEALRALRPSRRPVFLWGPPGVGKSSIVKQVSEVEEVLHLDVRVLLHDPSDFKFPLVDAARRRVDWIQSIFPTDPEWRGICCLEEIDKAPPLVQAALLQATLEHACGGCPLPQGLWFVACGNRQEDRAGANRMITPLLNRFVHLDLEVSNDDWYEWALNSNVRPEVVSFLRWKPALLHQFDPAMNQRAFPSPRSWHFVSDVLPTLPDHLAHAVVSGCVGDGPGAEFIGFLRIFQQLPDIDGLIAHAGTCTLPTEPAVLYALSGALIAKARADQKKLAPVATLATRMKTEFSVLCVRDLCGAMGARGQEVLKLPGMGDWLKRHRDLFPRRD